jgi:hypothetical protein
MPKIKFRFLFSAISLLSSFAGAQSTDSTPAAISPEKEYRFTIKGSAKKESATAVLKLSEKKDFVYLYFEGSALQSGKYKLLKGDSCTALKKLLRSKKLPEDSSELYAFETKYGNISGERNLEAKKLQEMGVDHMAIAIVKIENKNNIIISCVD